ncbi:MAG: hypothetical protein LQ339_005918 [Xanthoria mediterranea]|nr:MAG: hypothetical protein LQ339_005918 [Xanthoria mediterranea]
MDTFERKGVFRFMNLPQELRQMVYKFALISECTQPRIANSFQRGWANALLYSHNTFNTFCRPDAQQIWDILDLLAGEKGKQTLSNGWLVTRWTACEDAVAQSVSTIHDPDTSKLPAWLFGEFMPGAVPRCAEWDLWDPWALKPVPGYDTYGFYIAGFLRKIGPSNAAKIHNLELTFSSLPNAADSLPLFSEILKQHIKGLRKLVIDLDCINEWGFTMEFDERNECQAHHAIALFNELRILVKHLPHLQQIKILSIAIEIREIASAVLNEKRTGVAVDLRKKWAKLREEAAVHLLANPEIVN